MIFSLVIIFGIILAIYISVGVSDSGKQVRESFTGWLSSSSDDANNENPEQELVCILAGGAEGNKYCVRDRSKKKQAADLLANVAKRCREFVDRLFTDFPSNPLCQQLHQNFDETKISETLPNSEYTAFSENKGEKISFCLTPEKDSEKDGLIDEHTLMFVAIHELTHVGTSSVGHGDEFWNNFKFLLEKAKEYGIHDPVDYKATPAKYCSMQIKDNPIYDWKVSG
jgi:hypothetical protein